MKYIFVGLALLLLAGCGSGIGAHERLGWYLPFVPGDLVVEEFYETRSPSMDHEYMWKILIADNEDFGKFEQQLVQPPSNAVGVNDLVSAAIFDSHPRWWKKIKFDNGVLHKHRVCVVGSLSLIHI